MVRNLKTGNSSPFLPTRFWRNKKGPRELAFMTSASAIISGAAAVTSRIAQATSNNRLLPERAHGGAFGSAEVKVVGLVFSMILSL
jgi:hypothetical protein